MMPDRYYAYIHCRPDGSPFYVGKGANSRPWRKRRSHNKHHTNIVAKHGYKNILVGVMECSSEEAAFQLESGMIKCLRRMGISLVNRNDGGTGVGVGFRKLSEEERKAISARQSAKYQSDNEREMQSIRAKASWSDQASYEVRVAKLRVMQADPEMRARMRETQRQTLAKPDSKERRSLTQKALKNAPEVKRRNSERMLAKHLSPEFREKFLVSQRSESIRKARRENVLGKKLYTDGASRKFFYPDCAPSGFSLVRP